MKRATILWRAAATAALLSAVGASVAWAHGNPDQINDPPVQLGWSCAAEGADNLHQGFTPLQGSQLPDSRLDPHRSRPCRHGDEPSAG
jgi:hypothetical protein